MSRTIRAGVPRVVGRLCLAFTVVLLAACQPGNNPQPVPSVATIGGNLKCDAGDTGVADSQGGWGFCYPATWRYIEKAQASTVPPGLDITFDITDIPCVVPSAAPGGPSPHPICSSNAGNFGFMVVSTYERGNSANIAGWLQANGKDASVSPTVVLTAIQWGDSTEAYKLDDGRRIAMTQHHVVLLDLHCGSTGSRCDPNQGHINLEALMSARLNTWKFTF
jgi:hypothetical protein